MINRVILILTLLTVTACATVRDSKSTTFASDYPLAIIQDGNRTEINDSDTTISIDKKAFTLEFLCRKYDPENKLFYATGIAATQDVEEYKKVSVGPIAKDNKLFGYATGKSGYDDHEYETMYVDNRGHHYIFYSNEDRKRATLVEEIVDDYVRVSWTVNSFTINGVETPLDSTTIDQLYLLHYRDANLNDTIESGELTKLKILLN